MNGNGDFDWLCAECLRAIQNQHVMVRANDRGAYTLHLGNLYHTLATCGVKSLDNFGRPLYLYAVTMINGEYRCGDHLS